MGNWLVATFPGLYATLTGRTNAQFVGYCQPALAADSPTLEARVLALALSVYATSESLAGTAAECFGLKVKNHGVGASAFNVGSMGSALGFENGS